MYRIINNSTLKITEEHPEHAEKYFALKLLQATENERIENKIFV